VARELLGRLDSHERALKRAKKGLWRVATETGIQPEHRQAIAAEALTEAEEMVPSPGVKIAPLVADLARKAPRCARCGGAKTVPATCPDVGHPAGGKMTCLVLHMKPCPECCA
jgi:hypothetical protein